MLYQDLNTLPEILQAVERMGFTQMTEVQEKAIPVMQAGKDIIAKATAKGVKVGCFADTVEGGRKWRDLGVKFIGYACDTYIFMQAAKADVEAFARE